MTEHRERYYKTGMIPSSVPPGRVLAHNDMPNGLDGFRCWTWLKDEVPSNFKPCECGWSGLPHVSRSIDERPNNRRTKS